MRFLNATTGWRDLLSSCTFLSRQDNGSRAPNETRNVIEHRDQHAKLFFRRLGSGSFMDPLCYLIHNGEYNFSLTCQDYPGLFYGSISRVTGMRLDFREFFSLYLTEHVTHTPSTIQFDLYFL